MFFPVLFRGMHVRGWTLLLAVGTLSMPVAYGECGSGRLNSPKKGTSVVETTNFRIYGLGGTKDRWHVAEQLEAIRGRLCNTWLATDKVPTWSPKCEVVVHSTAAGYIRAVGQAQFATVGSSRVDAMGDKVTLRRLDICANQPGWFAAAVPHELTHLIMADEFRGGHLPVWADEGIAMLADSPAKQSLHLRDFNAGRRSGSMFRLASFVGESGYPSAEKVAVFYGQSLFLVRYLVERRTPAEFVRFLHLAEKAGYDAALGEVYGLGGVQSLEREWLASTIQPAQRAHGGDQSGWRVRFTRDGNDPLMLSLNHDRDRESTRRIRAP